MHYFNPVEIIFGSGVRGKIIDECSKKKVLIICSRTSLDRYSSDEELATLIKSSSVDFEHGFESNPSLKDLILISKKYSKKPPDLIIGLGGGSAMDVAKIVSVGIPGASKDIDIRELLEDSNLFSNFEPIKCLLIPTTAGTGSEVTHFATVWDYETNQKKSLGHRGMFAHKAFIDPDFLQDIPAEVSISTGLDALNQAFESLWNVNSTDYTRILCRQAILLSLKVLPNTNMISLNSEMRQMLSMASLLSGLAISQTRTSICHSISYPLTLKYKIDHGMACTFSFLEVFKFNLEYIKKDVEIIEQSMSAELFPCLEKVINLHKVYPFLSDRLPDKNSFSESLDDFVTEGRFENNIRKCNQDDLIKIVSDSYDSIMNSK